MVEPQYFLRVFLIFWPFWPSIFLQCIFLFKKRVAINMIKKTTKTRNNYLKASIKHPSPSNKHPNIDHLRPLIWIFDKNKLEWSQVFLLMIFDFILNQIHSLVPHTIFTLKAENILCIRALNRSFRVAKKIIYIKKNYLFESRFHLSFSSQKRDLIDSVASVNDYTHHYHHHFKLRQGIGTSKSLSLDFWEWCIFFLLMT